MITIPEHAARLAAGISHRLGPVHRTLRAIHIQAPGDIDHDLLAVRLRTRLGELGLPGVRLHITAGERLELERMEFAS